MTLTAAWPSPVEQDTWRQAAAPTKRICTQEELGRQAVACRSSAGGCHARLTRTGCMFRFLRSAAAKSFVGFVLSINEAVRDTPVSAATAASPAVEALTAALDALADLLEATPPAQHAMRYGNPAYRSVASQLGPACPRRVMYRVRQWLKLAVRAGPGTAA